MAILDTIIAQSSRLGLPAQPRREQDAASFRQELMGALALFTGGRSLAHSGQRDTSKVGLHFTGMPLPALTTAPEPPPFWEDPEHAGQKQALQKPIPPIESAPVTQPAQDWSTLLARKDHLTRQALKEVEPTLRNAEQALTRFFHLQARESDKTPPGADPTTLLQGFSATMTARSILGLHAPGRSSSPHADIDGQTSTPGQTIMPHLSTLLPQSIDVTSGERTTTSAHQENPLKRLSLVLTHAEQTLSQMTRDPSPTSSSFIPNKSALSQPIAQLVRHVEATPRSRHITTHNTTTHNPNVHITVQAGHSRPQDIARAVEASTIHALTRQTLTQTG